MWIRKILFRGSVGVTARIIFSKQARGLDSEIRCPLFYLIWC
jgi:hypothetical protein